MKTTRVKKQTQATDKADAITVEYDREKRQWRERNASLHAGAAQLRADLAKERQAHSETRREMIALRRALIYVTEGKAKEYKVDIQWAYAGKDSAGERHGIDTDYESMRADIG